MNDYPHVDPLVLHAPGTCPSCDAFPDAQLGRRLDNIAYTGEVTFLKIPCPSTTAGSDGSLFVPDGVTVRFTREMRFKDVTVMGTGRIETDGYPLYASGVLKYEAEPSAKTPLFVPPSPVAGSPVLPFEPAMPQSWVLPEVTKVSALLLEEQFKRTQDKLYAALGIPKEFLEAPVETLNFTRLLTELYAQMAEDYSPYGKFLGITPVREPPLSDYDIATHTPSTGTYTRVDVKTSLLKPLHYIDLTVALDDVPLLTDKPEPPEG
jgi:hypothetical protein